jgi:dipeptidyl aminopeptidase/acylaminoacyl peptidase
MPFRTLPVLLVLGSLAGVARPADRTHDVTPDDYFSLATVTQFAVSPDGLNVAYCEARWQQSTDDRKTDLWLVPTGEKPTPRRLTSDRTNDRSPKWSADGKTIYFLGNRKREAEKKPPYDGTTQVWRITPDGGEPQPVTRVEGGVSGYDFADDAGQVFYTTETTANDAGDFAALREKFGSLEYGHGKRKVSEVWRLDLTTWRAEKAVADKRFVREFAVTRDGKRIAMISAADDTVIRSEGESRVDVWEDGKVTTPDTTSYRRGAATPFAWLESLAWSPDGKRFAFCAVFDGFPAELVVGTDRDGTWEVARVSRTGGVQVRGYGTPLRWTADGVLVALAEKAGRVNAVAVRARENELTAPREWKPRVMYGIDTDAADKAGVALMATAERFPELFLLDGKGGPRRLTTLNPQAETWKLPTVKHVTWKAPDGTEVGGVLELPPGHEEGTKLPLVVAIHGGPTTSVTAELLFDPHNGRLYFSAAGYAVLCPNYRGSTGYGDKFVTDLIGRENDIEVNDIIAGIKSLIDQGIADPERVAVMGWSNGGYLTNCLITRKDLPFKLAAASSGAGIVDTVAEWGFNDEPAYPRVFKKGLPWETPDIYRKTSPTYALGNVTAATLIHVGGGDERCPPGHSRMLFRALKEYVGVPSELVVYPGEPHGLTKYTNRKAKMEWDLAWFGRYVKK